MDNNTQKFFRAKDIALILGVSRSVIYQYPNKGLLPQPIKVGIVSLWKKEDVDSLVEKIAKGGSQNEQ